MWRVEDNLRQSALSYSVWVLGNKLRLSFRLDCRHPYLLSHLASLKFFIIERFNQLYFLKMLVYIFTILSVLYSEFFKYLFHQNFDLNLNIYCFKTSYVSRICLILFIFFVFWESMIFQIPGPYEVKN